MSSSSSSPSISTSLSDHPYAKKEEKLKQRRRGVGHHQTAFRGFTIIKPPSSSANSNTSNKSDKSVNNDTNDNAVNDHYDYIDHVNDVGPEYDDEFNDDGGYGTCQPDIPHSPASSSYNTMSSCTLSNIHNDEGSKGKEIEQNEVEFVEQEEHLVQSLRVVSLNDSTSVEKQRRKTQIGVKENDSFEYTKVENRIQEERQSRGQNKNDGFTFIRREKKSNDVATGKSKHDKPSEKIKLKKKEEVNEDQSQPVIQKSKRKLVQKKPPATESHQPDTFDHYNHDDFDPLSVSSSEYPLDDVPASVSEYQATKSDKARIKPHKPRNDQNDTKWTKSTTVTKSTAMTKIDVNVEKVPRLTRAQSKVLGIKPVYQRKFGEDLKLFYKKREAE